MDIEFSYTVESQKRFDDVVKAIEDNTAANQFRVLAVHDVQQTLAEKGLERKPLKIIEICNAKFAHTALQKDPEVALFMPCRFAVYGGDGKTVVKLARPSVISAMMPDAGLEELASEVEETMKKVIEQSI